MPCFVARLLRIRLVVFVSPQRVKRDKNKTTNSSVCVSKREKNRDREKQRQGFLRVYFL